MSDQLKKLKRRLLVSLVIATLVGILVGMIMYVLVGVSLHYHPKPPLQAAAWLSLVPISSIPVLLIIFARSKINKQSGGVGPILMGLMWLCALFATVWGASLLMKDYGDHILYFPIFIYGVLLLNCNYWIYRINKLVITPAP